MRGKVAVAQPTQTIDAQVWHKVTAGDDQNEFVHYASQISGNNIDFILTLEQENGTWKGTTISKPNKNGTRDYGMCQLNSQYHWDYIQSEDFNDPKKQLHYCWDVYQKAVKSGKIKTTFYGYNARLKHKDKYQLITL